MERNYYLTLTVKVESESIYRNQIMPLGDKKRLTASALDRAKQEFCSVLALEGLPTVGWRDVAILSITLLEE